MGKNQQTTKSFGPGIIVYLYIMNEQPQIHDLNLKGNYETEFLAKNYGQTDENKELGLKTGDIIEFWGGHNNDIRYRSRILGFDTDGKAFMNWDCFWFAIDLTTTGKRDFNKVP